MKNQDQAKNLKIVHRILEEEIKKLKASKKAVKNFYEAQINR